MNTAATLMILREIAAIDFRPLTGNDYAAFEGAGDDAQIGFAGYGLGNAICEATGQSVSVEGREAIAVLISADRVEIHACDPSGDPIALAFNIADAL